MEIRVLTERDAADWQRLRREALVGEPFSFGQAVEEHDELPLATIEERLRQALDRAFTLGAFEGADLVGMMTFVREGARKRRHIGNVYAVYVTPSHRGRGVGRGLLSYLIELVSGDPSMEQLELAVTGADAAAKRLYAAAGFQSYGVEPRGLKIGGEYTDHELMVLKLR